MAFRKLYNHAKLDEFGAVVGASAAIFDQETGENLVAQLIGDYRQSSDTELIEAVLDNFFKRTYADRAMSEAVQTVDELKRQSASFEKSIKDAKEWINSVNTEIETLKQEALTEIRATTEQNQEMIKLSTMMLNDALEQLEELFAQKEENHDDVIGNAEETDRGGTTDE